MTQNLRCKTQNANREALSTIRALRSALYAPRFTIYATRSASRGFIALISIIIISAILMLVAVTLSFTGFYGRYNALDSEFKERSLALAEACAEEAILKIVMDAGYFGSETVEVEDEQCTIGAITVLGNIKTFRAEAVFGEAYTNLEISYDFVNRSIASWEEVP